MFSLPGFVRIALGTGGIALLSSCAVGPDFVAPAAPQTQHYTYAPQSVDAGASQGLTQRFSPATELPADWWQLFKSPALDAAVARALVNSPTLQATEANLRVAQDNLRAGDAVFFPWLDTNVGAQQVQSASAQQGSTLPGSIYNVRTLSGSVSYPLDLFGGERRSSEGLSALVDVQRHAGQAAFLTLTANVVNTCIARAAYLAQIRLTEALIVLETDQLRSSEAQVRSGTAPYANLLSQRSLIAANQALLAPLRQKASQAEHLLVLLQGDLPSQSSPPVIELETLTLPTDLPLSLPSQWVHQRPDILGAEAQLHVASANIGVATAALYPNITLNATLGTTSSSLSHLFDATGNFWSIGSSLTAPLFHGGALRAQRQGARDAFDAAKANYRLTVLSAFTQVADALKALNHDAQALQAQVDSEQNAHEALLLLQANYRAGLVAYVDVLTADVQFHTASIAKLQGVAQRYQDTVGLFVALGGGWWNQPAAKAHAPSP